jgi:hypothetical protein
MIRIRHRCQVGAVELKEAAGCVKDARGVRRVHGAGHHEHVAIGQQRSRPVGHGVMGSPGTERGEVSSRASCGPHVGRGVVDGVLTGIRAREGDEGAIRPQDNRSDLPRIECARAGICQVNHGGSGGSPRHGRGIVDLEGRLDPGIDSEDSSVRENVPVLLIIAVGLVPRIERSERRRICIGTE